MTKPEGLTTSEALACGRPMLFAHPIPGQEEGNARALVAAGAAITTPTDLQLTAAIRRAFREPGLLGRLAGAARSLGRPDAAAEVAGRIAGPANGQASSVITPPRSGQSEPVMAMPAYHGRGSARRTATIS